MEDIDQDQHYRERESFYTVEDPATGLELEMPGLPFRLLGQPGKIRFPGLPHGAANEVIYSDLLGYSDEDLQKARESGAI